MKRTIHIIVCSALAACFLTPHKSFADNAGRIFGLTGAGAAIGGIAGGGRGAVIGTGVGLGLGLLTSRRRRDGRGSRRSALADLRRERREVERELNTVNARIEDIKSGRINASSRELNQLQNRAKRLERQREDIEDEIDNLT